MRLRHVVFCLAVAVLFAVALLVRRPAPPPPEVTLPDGSHLKVVAVTYGTNHVVGPLLGRLTARLPKAVADHVRRFGGARFDANVLQTSTWEMRVW